jgi:hypothetical protein
MSFAPWGYSAVGLSMMNKSPKDDLLCWLDNLLGYEHSSLYRTLESQYGVDINFKPSPSTSGVSFAYTEGKSGIIYSPHPADGEKGTRADRLASFVEEVWHAAQFHDMAGGVNCRSSLREGEEQAQTKKFVWKSTVTLINYVPEAAFINTKPYNVNDKMAARPLFKSTMTRRNNEAVCPDPTGGWTAVPWSPLTSSLLTITNLSECDLTTMLSVVSV